MSLDRSYTYFSCPKIRRTLNFWRKYQCQKHQKFLEISLKWLKKCYLLYISLFESNKGEYTKPHFK